MKQTLSASVMGKHADFDGIFMRNCLLNKMADFGSKLALLRKAVLQQLILLILYSAVFGYRRCGDQKRIIQTKQSLVPTINLWTLSRSYNWRGNSYLLGLSNRPVEKSLSRHGIAHLSRFYPSWHNHCVTVPIVFFAEMSTVDQCGAECCVFIFVTTKTTAHGILAHRPEAILSEH